MQVNEIYDAEIILTSLISYPVYELTYVSFLDHILTEKPLKHPSLSCPLIFCKTTETINTLIFV